MKKFLKYFRIPFILIGILMVITIIIRVSSSGPEEIIRNNDETDLTQNVFNYAGNLTDSNVAELESLIERVEEQTSVMANKRPANHNEVNPLCWTV